MNDKLIRRAAIKYHDWMLKQAELPPYDGGRAVLARINRVITKSQEMEKWTKRYFRGVTQRVQVNFWEPAVEHMGIVNRDVYKSIVTDMVPELENCVITDIQHTINLLGAMTRQSIVTPLTIREAIEEIRIIDETWEDVEFMRNTLSVLIKNVTLSDESEVVELGSFTICLNLDRPLDGPSIESVSGVEAEGGHYHPHVENNNLCAGDGDLPMKNALCQGRLEDYFRIIEATLRTYNENSAYETLNEWYDPSYEDQFYCESCNEWRPNEELCFCEGCQIQYCDRCGTGDCCTECGEYFCDNCFTICHGCKQAVCHNCSLVCGNCNETICSSCISTCVSCNNGFCESCTKSCNCCGDVICEDCIVECGHCGYDCCSNCVDATCNECGNNICEECKIVCDHCGKIFCINCNDEHNCLLSKVEN